MTEQDLKQLAETLKSHVPNGVDFIITLTPSDSGIIPRVEVSNIPIEYRAVLHREWLQTNFQVDPTLKIPDTSGD